jgi:death on curing protein
MSPYFLDQESVMDIHHESLSRHGGIDGLRDEDAFLAALAAAENCYHYADGDLHDIAAAYAFHLSESQSFLDGNKRTAIGTAMTFLLINGCEDAAQDEVLYGAMIAIARRELDKGGLATLLREQFPQIAQI